MCGEVLRSCSPAALQLSLGNRIRGKAFFLCVCVCVSVSSDVGGYCSQDTMNDSRTCVRICLAKWVLPLPSAQTAETPTSDEDGQGAVRLQ